MLDESSFPCKILKLSQQINRLKSDKEKEEVRLTSADLQKIRDIFKSLNELNACETSHLRVFKEFENLIQKCDSSSTNRRQLLHLSHLILNHFSPQSITWILAIYKKVMKKSPVTILSSTQNDEELIQRLLNSSKQITLEDKIRKFTCLDLENAAQQADALNQVKYARLLVDLITYHITQE